MMRNLLFEEFGDLVVRGYVTPDSAFGANARSIDFESKYAQGTGVFDTFTDEILALFIRDSLGRGHRYAWVAKYIKDYENLMYSVTEDIDDIFEKTHALLGNRRFDPRVVMQFDLDDQTLDTLNTLALRLNVTLDEAVEHCLRYAIENEIASTD